MVESTGRRGRRLRFTIPLRHRTAPEALHTNVYGNETRVLLGTNAAFKRPCHNVQRLWVRWPAKIWRATGQRFVPRVRLV